MPKKFHRKIGVKANSWRFCLHLPLSPLLFFQSLATIFVRQDKDDSSFPPQQDFKPTDRGREGERRHICACAHSYALHSSGTDKRRREVDISCRSELSIPDDTRSRYRAPLEGGPYVARSFCLALPGCCLAKQVLLSVDLCTNST